MDSFPVPVCHPCRSWRCRLYKGKEYLGTVLRRSCTPTVLRSTYMHQPNCRPTACEFLIYALPRALPWAVSISALWAEKKLKLMRLKVHLVVTTAGDIWEFYVTPASVADITALKSMDLDLPDGATLFGPSLQSLFL